MPSSHDAPPAALYRPLEVGPDDWRAPGFYQLLTALVVPRPIGWISTISDSGVRPAPAMEKHRGHRRHERDAAGGTTVALFRDLYPGSIRQPTTTMLPVPRTECSNPSPLQRRVCEPSVPPRPSFPWLISDIYLDGAISEVATRRSEFGAILKNEGVDGLIAALKCRNAAPRACGPRGPCPR